VQYTALVTNGPTRYHRTSEKEWPMDTCISLPTAVPNLLRDLP